MSNNQRVYHLLVLDGCYPSRLHIDGVHRPQRIILGFTHISHRPKEIQVLHYLSIPGFLILTFFILGGPPKMLDFTVIEWE